MQEMLVWLIVDGLVERLYSSKFIVACNGRGFVLGACEVGHAKVYVVHWCDCGMGEMMMYEFNCVGDLGRLGGFCHNCVACVVLERYTDIPSSCAAEVPQVSCPGLFVCYYVAAEGSNWFIVVIERSVEI